MDAERTSAAASSFPPPFFGPIAGLGTPLAPHIVGVFQQLGKAQDSHKRREIL